MLKFFYLNIFSFAVANIFNFAPIDSNGNVHEEVLEIGEANNKKEELQEEMHNDEKQKMQQQRVQAIV